MSQKLPDNFAELHEGEELIRAKSIEAIESNDDFLKHAILIERAMNVINYFCYQYVTDDEDGLTIQLLGIRLFNGTASALKLLLSGYYQTSALQQRDLLETIFLLDYFSTEKSLIAQWRNSNERDRIKNFKPVIVRTALDNRDGFTERKREIAYKQFCELAGHPTYAGFRMLAPEQGGDAHCGPFFEIRTFKAVYEELTKLLIQAGGKVMSFFDLKTDAERLMELDFMELQGRWSEHFYGRPFDRSEIDEIRALIKNIQESG